MWYRRVYVTPKKKKYTVVEVESNKKARQVFEKNLKTYKSINDLKKTLTQLLFGIRSSMFQTLMKY